MKIRTMVKGLAIVTICGMMVGCESTPSKDEVDLYGMISNSDIKGVVNYIDDHCECHCQDTNLDFNSEDEVYDYLENNCECYRELEGYKESAQEIPDEYTRDRVVGVIKMCQLLHACGYEQDDKYLDKVIQTYEDNMEYLEQMKQEEQELNDLFDENDQYGYQEF